MSFQVIKDFIEIAPLEEKAIVASQKTTYEEKGKIVGLSDTGDYEMDWEIGDVVYFDAWLAKKYVSEDGSERWVVKETAICAYEQPALSE